MAKLMNKIIILSQEDKAKKLGQLFGIIKGVFEEHSDKTSKFKYCDIFKTQDGSIAVREAIKQKDTLCLKEILKLEYDCHPQNSREGIRCFREVIRTDERSTEITEMLDNMYGKSVFGKYVVPIFMLLPLLIRLFSIIYDETTDVLLAIDYHNLSSSTIDNRFSGGYKDSCFSGSPRSSHQYNTSNMESCDGELPVHVDDYHFAKWYIIFSVGIMLLMNGPLTSSILMRKKNPCIKDEGTWKSTSMNVVCVFVSPFISPIIIIWELIKIIHLKWKIIAEQDEAKKAKLVEKFWDSQLEFGMFEAIEAAEASAQLLLQVWLLSSKFECYYAEGFWAVVQRAFIGSFFVFRESTSTEDRTLGKIMISFISIILSAFSMYRRTKREAVHALRSPFLMVSILSQIFVHIMCLLPLYFVERHPLGLVLPILMHYLLILVLKVLFDPSLYLAKSSNKMIAFFNVIGSIIINVNLTPRDGYNKYKGVKKKVQPNILGAEKTNPTEQKKNASDDQDQNETGENNAIITVVHHTPSTFFLQAMYFAIKLIENLTILLIVLCYCHKWTGPELAASLQTNIGIILGLGSVMSWVSHSLYYRVYGHPWKYSNGPSLGKWYFKCQLYLLGNHKSNTLCCSSPKDHGTNESSNDLAKVSLERDALTQA